MKKELVQPSQSTNKILLMAVILAGAFVVVLNQTLLNNALPGIMKDLLISPSTAQWLTTGFMLVNGVMIPATAFLIEKFSAKKLFLVAMSFFAIGTLVGAFAPNFSVLLTARVLQAVGAGVMIPLIQTVILLMYPVEKRGSAMGMVGLVLAFAPAIGPTLSGWIVESYSWRVLFYVLLPIVLVVIIFAIFVLKNETKQTNLKIDIVSLILSTLGFSGLLYGFSSSGNIGWDSAEVLITLIGGVVSLILFTWRQLVIKNPLLELRVLKNKTFVMTLLIGMTVMLIMIGIQLILPLYMVNARGYTALESGLMLLPGAIIMGIMSPITGKIFDKVGIRPLAITGLLIVTVMAFLFSNFTATTSFTYMSVINAILMFGISLIMMPLMTAGLNELPNHLIPHGSALNNTLRTVVSSIGAAILVTVMSNRTKEATLEQLPNPMVHGVQTSFTIVAYIALVSLVLAFFLRVPKKAEVKKEGLLAEAK